MRLSARVTTLLLLSLALLGGCVSAPKSRPFNAAAHADLTHVEVLPMRQTALDVYIVNNPGASFGLIGGLIAEAHLASRRSWLKEQIEAKQFDHVETFRTAFAEAMAREGYTLSWPNGNVEAAKPKIARNIWGVRKAYPAPSEPAAQALLDVNFGFVGLASAGSSDGAPYRPTVVLTARLMDASGKTELFQEVITYNNVFPNTGNTVLITPDPAYAYPDFDALKAAGTAPIDGLDQAFRRVAERLAQLLSRS
ncbi:MAG: hypothetical protein H4O13_07550 [Xanthomonadales bacterium]|nr:hypothetical protein [Xanthomonadales bacterium]